MKTSYVDFVLSHNTDNLPECTAFKIRTVAEMVNEYDILLCSLR